MKHKIILLAIIATILVGCKPNEPEEKTPTALFSYAKNELKVTFSNSSQNARSYLWNFGDGHTSKEKNPIHTYANAGTYNVQLTATNITKSNTYSQNVTISQTDVTPNASFTYKTEHPLKVVITNTSSNATSYEWDFGDGTTSTEKHPTHKYKTIGVYRVKLIAKGSKKSDTHETNVEIKAPTTCTIIGFTITKIPTNNKYYQVQLTDDYWIDKTTCFWSKWFLLSSANLPYDYTLSSAKTLDIAKTYVARLYKYTGTGNPSNTQASGKGDWTATISPSDLKAYPETLSYSNSTAGMKLIFQWK